ncbi:MAG: metallophosphoesterase family protein [Sandaracinaceae bacterium]
MRLYAVSDLHVGFKANRQLLAALPAHPDDWLIVAGDVGETLEQMAFALETLVPRFAQVLWVPGNHELWTLPSDEGAPRGEARYQQLVDMCRAVGVLTPEDPFPLYEGEGGPAVVAPLFVGYDYTFVPDEVGVDRALAWAAEEDLVCADEAYLHPDPYESKGAWCRQRAAISEARLDDLDPRYPTVIVNHYPLHEDHAVLPRIPRFKIWCGTKLTERWPERYRARVVVYGHLHIPSTRFLDGVRYEEVSVGYPKQWKNRPFGGPSLRPILPEPSSFPYDWDTLVARHRARLAAKAKAEGTG